MANLLLWKRLYLVKWANESDLRRAVQLGGITPENFKEITGKDYEEVV